MSAFTKRFCLSIIVLLSAAGLSMGAESISLAGRWSFRIDERKAGVTEKWFSGDLAGGQHIKLPGTMDDAGLGPKNTKTPTLEGPYRLYNYAGPAWYQRDITIPAEWAGRRVTLFLERCRWVTTVYLDDKVIGTRDSLIAPHAYDFGTGVQPGKHRLTICVDNTVKLDQGRFVSALFGGTWGNMNGIVGRIELASTPPVWIDDVQVYPDVEKKSARVQVKIGNATGKPGQGTVIVGRQTGNAVWNEKGGQVSVTVDMAGAKLWDEFSPNLQKLTVQLNAGGLGVDSREVSFGMRSFAARGTQFTLNGRPVYLRGTLECSVFPLTGYPPTDVKAWQRIYRIMKSYGLNHIRFHSWCPPDAAFAAADIEGIMVQAEGPQANVNAGNNPARDAFIEAEFKRMVDTYGNHPSFCTMTLGNEYGGKAELLSRWVGMLIERDPRHLYSSASSAQTTGNRQWTESPNGRGIHGPGTERDLRNVVASDGRPIIGHEIGQWMYYPDFNEIKKYTGVMAVKNFEMIRDDLAKKHQLDLAPRYVEACGKFATLLYKEEIEVLLRTKGYAGFSLLDLHDYPTQGTALVGPLDPFWDSKGFITPAAYSLFCGPTVPLLRMPKRTYTSDEPFVADIDLAHYGAGDLKMARPVWAITDERDREIAAGTLPALTVPTGKLTALGKITASLAKAAAPVKLKVTVSLRGTRISNEWEIWVYPPISNDSFVKGGQPLERRLGGTPRPTGMQGNFEGRAKPPAEPMGFDVCDQWDKAREALDGGRKVVYFAAAGSPSKSMAGAFLPVFWSPVWFPSQRPNTMGLLCDPGHPLLAKFPTESHSNWQWYNLMQKSRLFILDDAPADYRPLVQVIDNFARNHRLGLVFEGRVGAGRLLVCGINLPAMDKDPAARQLMASVYAYAGSAAFSPSQEIDPNLLDQMFGLPQANQLKRLGARIRTDSADSDYPPELAIDGNPETLWHTGWKDAAPEFPHYLIVELPQPVKIAGLTCLPRQDNNPNGGIKGYAVYISGDGKDWGQPVARGSFTKGEGPQTIRFAQPVSSRFIKFVAESAWVSSKPYASLAELDGMVVP